MEQQAGPILEKYPPPRMNSRLSDGGVCGLTLHRGLWYFPIQAKRPFKIPIPDGHIGAVTGIPYKVYAAQAEQLDRVLIPEEHHPLDGEWRIPFLLHVSHVGTLEKAYQGLTERPLFANVSSP